MLKNGIFQSYCLRWFLEVLAWEAGLLALFWYLNGHYSLLMHLSFSDVLFALGILECTIASAGLMGRPYEYSEGPMRGVFALPVQLSEDEKRNQMLANIMEQKSFGLKVLAIGLLTLLLSVVLYLVNR